MHSVDTMWLHSRSKNSQARLLCKACRFRNQDKQRLPNTSQHLSTDMQTKQHSVFRCSPVIAHDGYFDIPILLHKRMEIYMRSTTACLAHINTTLVQQSVIKQALPWLSHELRKHTCGMGVDVTTSSICDHTRSRCAALMQDLRQMGHVNVSCDSSA